MTLRTIIRSNLKLELREALIKARDFIDFELPASGKHIVAELDAALAAAPAVDGKDARTEALRVISTMAICEDGETAEQRSLIVDACREVAANALAAAPAVAPQTLNGMIAAIYGDLDAEDCRRIDRAWIEWRGRGTITSSLASLSATPAIGGEAKPMSELEGEAWERGYQHGLVTQPISPLRATAERVCLFDWSDNDMDAVAAIDALRKAVVASPEYATAQPQYLANCKHSVSQCETYGQCLGVDCQNAGMAIVHRLCVEPKQDGIVYPEIDS
jgi:hypothetical protein